MIIYSLVRAKLPAVPLNVYIRLNAICGLLLVLILLFACQRGPVASLPLSGILPIAVPTVATTGQQIHVEIGPVSADNGTLVGLILVGAHGPRVYVSTFEAGMARFVIPSGDTHQPGYMALIAAADEARGEASILLFTRQPETAAYPANNGISIS